MSHRARYPRQAPWTRGATAALLAAGLAACASGSAVPDAPLPDAPPPDAPPPAIAVDRTLIVFVDPFTGGEYTETFTIANDGPGALVVSDLALTDNTANGDLEVVGPDVPFTVAPGGQPVTVSVILRPTDNGIPSGFVNVLSNDPVTPDVPVQIVSSVHDTAQLTTCVLVGLTMPDGCTTDPGTGAPLADLGEIDYGASASRVVAMRNTGGGSVALEISAIDLVGEVPLDPYTLELYLFDSTGTEVPVELPVYLNPVDPTGQVAQNELRARVTFTADGVDGLISGASLSIIADHPAEGSETTVPIIGSILGCRPDHGDCDGSSANGCEGDFLADPAHCGGCGDACSAANSTPACDGGACTIECVAGWGDCNLDARTDGCETDLTTAASHCGGCGTSCWLLPNVASAWCTDGICGFDCAPPFGDCDGSVGSGCETDLATSAIHCGACGLDCATLPHVSSGTCTGGSCDLTCASGWLDCDDAQATGCEADPLVSTTDCGGCDMPCSANHGSPTCSAGTCSIGCDPGFDDCNADPRTDGCEASLLTDPATCGGCTSCSAQNPAAPNVASWTCGAGTCGIGSCAGGAFDIDGAIASGCECSMTTFGGSCSGNTAVSVPRITPVTSPIVRTGGIPTAGGSAWFFVTFAKPSMGTPYHFRVTLANDSGGEFLMHVRPTCTAFSTCTSGTGQNVDVWEVATTYSGTAPSDSPAPPSAVYVQITRAAGAPATCNTFRVELANY